LAAAHDRKQQHRARTSAEKPKCTQTRQHSTHLGLLLSQAHQQVSHRIVRLLLRRLPRRLHLPLHLCLADIPAVAAAASASLRLCSLLLLLPAPLGCQLQLQLLHLLLQAAGVSIQGAVSCRQVLQIHFQLACRSPRSLRILSRSLRLRLNLVQLLRSRSRCLLRRSQLWRLSVRTAIGAAATAAAQAQAFRQCCIL
jgi:hypothetical protein